MLYRCVGRCRPFCVRVQIADFGLSQLIAPGQRLTKVCGTWAYAAPEMAEPRRFGGYDCKFDTWSFGVILFVVLVGYHPFDPDGNLSAQEVRPNPLECPHKSLLLLLLLLLLPLLLSLRLQLLL